jgi:anti-anti-sigma factor
LSGESSAGLLCGHGPAGHMDTEIALFEARVEPQQDAAVVVRLSGDVDLSVSPMLEEVLIEVLRGGAGRVIVDLRDLRFMDSSGINALVRGYRMAADGGRTLSVCNATGMVARVLEITGVARALAAGTSQAEQRGA